MLPAGPSVQDDDPIDVLHKHVNAIALMPVTTSITVLARRIYNVLLVLAMEQGDRDEYSSPLREIVELSNYSSGNIELLKKTLRQLVSVVVEWQSPSSGEIEVWSACGLLSGVDLTKNRRSRMITISWRYDTKLRAQLMNPERYARLSLEAITQLRSHSALALYEICARYVSNPRHLTARQPWQWWRPILTGNPVNPKAKPQYRYFKRDVLERAVAEINATTNLQVRGPIEFKDRDNRTITDIQFEVYLKSELQEAGQMPARRAPVADLPLVGRAIAAGVAQEEAEKLLEKFGGPALAAGLDALDARLRMPADRVTSLASPAKWLKSIVPGEARRLAEQGGEAARTARPADAAKRRARWVIEWITRRRDSVHRDFTTLAADAQRGCLAAYRASLVERVQTQLLRRLDASGWTHRMVFDDFIRFYASATLGDGWDKPSDAEILALAAEIGDEAG